MSFSIPTRIPAAALAIALGTTAVAVPQVTHAPVAQAQQAESESHFAPSAVKFDGIKDKEGNTVSGTLLSPGYKGKHRDADGTVIPDNGDFTFNFSIDVADAQGGDRVYIQPTTRYTPVFGKNAGNAQESHWVGTRVIGNVPNRPLEMNGVQIGTVDIVHGGGIRVTFNDAVSDFKSGTAQVSATAHSWDSFESAAEEVDVRDNGGPLSIQVSTYRADENGKYSSTPVATAEIPTNNNTKFNSIQQQTNALRNRVYTTAGAVSVTPEGEGILHFVRYQAPAGADYEVALRANDIATDYEAQWLMTKDIKHSLVVAEYDDNGEETGSVAGEKAIAEKYPDMSVDVSFENSTIHIKATNVPEGVQPIVEFRDANNGALGVASYQPNAIFEFKRDYTPLDKTAEESRTTVNRTISRIPAVAGMPENEGVAYKRTAVVTPMVAGFAKGVGTTGEPAPVAGTKQTFEFEVHNTGETYMAAPEVTMPNGEKKIVAGVKIAPGETGVVQVPYDVPKDATRLNFGVDFPRYTLNAKEHTFRIGPVDHSAEEQQKTLDEIKDHLKEQEKTLSGLKDELAKNNDLTQDEIDAINKQTEALEKAIDEQKKAIDTLTDAVNKGAEDLATKIDEQTKAINDQTKAIDDGLTSLEKTIKDGNKAQLDELKKQTAALEDNTAALREQTETLERELDGINDKLADQNAELKKQTAELEKQSETLKRQAEALEGVKAELDEANKLSAEANLKLQGLIDESHKQVEALNGLIKSNNKQTAMLDAQLGQLNDTQKAALAESIKQSKDLSRIAAALERANEISLMGYKAQLAQWKIENGFAQDEQNMRHHKANFGRCVGTDPATPLLFLIPAGLALMFNMPGMNNIIKSAGDQIGALNYNIGKSMGAHNPLAAELNKNAATFNKNYGDALRVGGASIGALGAAVAAAIAISNLVNNCMDDADKSVGFEPQEHTSIKDSALSSRK